MNLPNIKFMLNIDMAGRMDTSTKTVTIHGTGTSPVFDSLITTCKPAGLNIKTDKEIVNGSDQMPFYKNKIPCLFITTGIHDDYHKITDDPEKINFEGLLQITLCLERLIKKSDNAGNME
ncbi:MAG: M28 family peptidase [Bacteroidia bacterium]|nr:M28 family peptidase [Bacteroidia bacterium]